MTQDPITSELEASRVQELETVLSRISNQLVEYAAKANSKEGSVGVKIEPKSLREKLNLTLPDKGHGIDGLLELSQLVLDNSVVTWNEGFLDKLYASTNPVGIASDMLLSILNTNSHVFTVSPALTLIEKKTAHEYAKLFGFTGPHAGGLTFPGGSYSNFTSLTIARSSLFPDTKTKGNGDHRFAVFASDHAHYSVEKAAIFLGLGSDSIFRVQVTDDGRMDAKDLETKIQAAKSTGFTPLYVNATAGTTVFGSFDDFTAIGEIASKYGIWFHVDGSWGGNVVFSDTHRAKLQGIHTANSITVNPHKMLGVPTTCSFLLVPDDRIMQKATSLLAPYLFHNSDPDQENFDLADATMGCGRRPDALKLFLGWNWYGKKGYGDRIDHAFKVTEYLAKTVASRPGFHLVSQNPPPCLQTCFYYSPKGDLSSDPDENSRVTRHLATELHRRGQFLVDYAPVSGPDSKGEFFRVVINSPM